MGLRSLVYGLLIHLATFVAIAPSAAAAEPEQVFEKSTPRTVTAQALDTVPTTASPDPAAGTSSSPHQPERAQLVRELRRLAGDAAFLNGINPYPPGTAAYASQNEFVTAVFANERFVDRLAALLSEQEAAGKDYEAVSGEILMTWMKAGLRRLDDSDKESLLALFRKMLDYGSAEQCATIIRGDPLGLVAEQLIAKLDTFDVEAYYLVIKRALFAEIEEKPEPTLTQAEKQVAQQALLGWAKGLDPAEAQRFRATFSDPANAPDSELCWSGKKMMDGILNAEGDTRHWLVRLYFTRLD